MTVRPSAHGTLAKTPFAHLLLYMQARKLSGTLAVWPDEGAPASGQDRILFESGQLLAMRPIEPAKSLYAALIPLFARSAPYGFYEGHDLLGQAGILREPIEVETLLARGLRAHASEPLMDSVLERLSGRRLRLRPTTALERLELNARELAALEPLQGGAATFEEVLAHSTLAPRDVKRTLYLLTLLRALESTESKQSIPAVAMDSFPPRSDSQPASGESSTEGSGRTAIVSAPPAANTNSGVSKSAPPAPLGLSAQDESRWNEIASLYHRRDELTHYELLNVPKTASASDIQGAYFGLVKRIHPDRLPLPLAPLARAAQAVFERLTEANETLGNPALRGDYDKAVAGGGGTRAADRTLRNVLESALDYQKAEVLVRRREYAQAQQLLRSALEKNPDDADYHALYAWILHLMNPTQPAPLDEMLRSLDRALKSNPQHERAHYYKGVVLKRLKRDAEAVRHFRTAAEINPRNVDAAREVRLAVMRRESQKPPSGNQGGVLSRLFNKK